MIRISVQGGNTAPKFCSPIMIGNSSIHATAVLQQYNRDAVLTVLVVRVGTSSIEKYFTVRPNTAGYLGLTLKSV